MSTTKQIAHWNRVIVRVRKTNPQYARTLEKRVEQLWQKELRKEASI